MPTTVQEAGKASTTQDAIVAPVPQPTIGAHDSGIVTVQEAGKAPVTQRSIAGTITKQ